MTKIRKIGVSLAIGAFVSAGAASVFADGQGQGSGNVKTPVCHVPPGNPAKAHTLTLPQGALLQAHRAHGDVVGACGGGAIAGQGTGGTTGGASSRGGRRQQETAMQTAPTQSGTATQAPASGARAATGPKKRAEGPAPAPQNPQAPASAGEAKQNKPAKGKGKPPSRNQGVS